MASPIIRAGICAGTGIESQIAGRVRDGHGTQLARGLGSGRWQGHLRQRRRRAAGGNTVRDAGRAGSFRGSVKNGPELHKVAEPVTFGPALGGPYRGSRRLRDTSSGIAKKHYGDANGWPIIFAPDRHEIQDPATYFPGRDSNSEMAAEIRPARPDRAHDRPAGKPGERTIDHGPFTRVYFAETRTQGPA
jgi:hypothetical protein